MAQTSQDNDARKNKCLAWKMGGGRLQEMVFLGVWMLSGFTSLWWISVSWNVQMDILRCSYSFRWIKRQEVGRSGSSYNCAHMALITGTLCMLYQITGHHLWIKGVWVDHRHPSTSPSTSKKEISISTLNILVLFFDLKSWRWQSLKGLYYISSLKNIILLLSQV